MTTWFISDTHWYHTNIIKFCDRPWPTSDEMNLGLVKKWNDRVSAKDDVYHLGDVSFANKVKALDIVSQLNGRKHLIAGNHDFHYMKEYKTVFETVDYFKELRMDKKKIAMSHYPFHSWRGTWHLHGHSHGKHLPVPGVLRIDVGVDVHWHRKHQHLYAPVSYEELRESMNFLENGKWLV